VPGQCREQFFALQHGSHTGHNRSSKTPPSKSCA
jgi:hypothetical protein